jgi:hypothetical protein
MMVSTKYTGVIIKMRLMTWQLHSEIQGITYWYVY